MNRELLQEAPPFPSFLRSWRVGFLAVFLIALLARVPFFATHHIQEDAYITFRSAFHLADAGDYSFNLGDHDPGVTSVLYGPMIAAVRVLFRSDAIAALSVLNTIIFLAGAALLSCSFFESWRERAVLFAAIALLPEGLLISYTGMEIPLQVALFCAAIFTLRRGRATWLTLACILLLPLIRPDAIAYSLILSALVFSFEKIRGLLAIACTVAGAALVLAFNRLTTGHFLSATMRAKEISYHPQHNLHTFLTVAKTILIHRSYLLPVESKLVEWSGPLVTVLVLAGCVLALRMVRQQPARLRLFIACLAAGLLVPCAYMYGGIIFPWYLWTSNWLCFSLLCFAIVKGIFLLKPPAFRAALLLLATGWVAMDTVQWLVSCNIGLQEYQYRAGVGRWLHTVARPNDTLELEPAGYVPFYAGIRTYDEIGLVSPLVLNYRERYQRDWWIEFLRQQHPDWLVRRVHLSTLTDEGVPLSPADAHWFEAHYTLVQHFHYSPANYLHPGLLLRLMQNGYHNDYYAYHSTGLP